MDAAASTITKTAKKSRKAHRAPATEPTPVTLSALAEQYVGQLARDGKSLGTQLAYRMELKTALDELGAESPLATLNEDQVRAYFESDRVTKRRNGREKSKLTIDKTRRVLRLALIFAAARGMIESAPLPRVASAVE